MCLLVVTMHVCLLQSSGSRGNVVLKHSVHHVEQSCPAFHELPFDLHIHVHFTHVYSSIRHVLRFVLSTDILCEQEVNTLHLCQVTGVRSCQA